MSDFPFAIHPEGRPDGKGIQTARELTAVGIPVTLILDTGVAYVMERVDMVLCGAEGVVESGGIINNLGTYQIAVVARAFHKPVYVAAESYKVGTAPRFLIPTMYSLVLKSSSNFKAG
jgi:translation initiation factor 2B subunit (eIF-2B alpha/beta/delta family)